MGRNTHLYPPSSHMIQSLVLVYPQHEFLALEKDCTKGLERWGECSNAVKKKCSLVCFFQDFRKNRKGKCGIPRGIPLCICVSCLNSAYCISELRHWKQVFMEFFKSWCIFVFCKSHSVMYIKQNKATQSGFWDYSCWIVSSVWFWIEKENFSSFALTVLQLIYIIYILIL